MHPFYFQQYVRSDYFLCRHYTCRPTREFGGGGADSLFQTLDRAARWHQTQMPLVNTGHQSLHIQRLASENLDQQVKRVFTQAYLLYIVHDTLHISLEVVLSDFRQKQDWVTGRA